MNIELKKVKTFIGNEGQGLNAEVWVDGVKTCFVIDDASGSIMYDFGPVYNKEKFKELEDYVASLPDYPLEINGEPCFEKDGVTVMMMKPSMEGLIDDAFEKFETARVMKRLAKKFVNKILWGKKKITGKYTEVTFKKPLHEIPTHILQGYVDKYKAELKDDEMFYNTNFDALKIKV
jgi:hypothetical protein